MTERMACEDWGNAAKSQGTAKSQGMTKSQETGLEHTFLVPSEVTRLTF